MPIAIHANVTQLRPSSDWTACAHGGHLVQFYEDDAFLNDAITRFIGRALDEGHGAIVIGTPSHRDALEARLLQSRLEELAEFDQRKNEFLAMLGHELRNPLSPILSALEILKIRRVRRRQAIAATPKRKIAKLDRGNRLWPG